MQTLGLPYPEDIHRYTIAYGQLDELHGFSPALIILLFKNTPDAESMLKQSGLQALLLDDEVGNTSQLAAKIRSSGLHVITTLTWATKAREATFWLRRDTIDRAKDAWKIGLWRSDTWRRVCAPVAASSVQKTGKSWLD